MKHMIKRKPALITVFIIALALMVTIIPSLVSAAAITASLSPSSSSVQQGNTFTVNVNLSTGSANILDVIGRVNFNTSQLQYISASYAPSTAWGTVGPSAGLNGSYYTFDVFTLSNQSGNLGVVQITFKALASSGSSSITLSNVESGDGDNPPPAVHSVSLQNTSVTLTSPPAAPATPATTPSTSTAPKTPISATPTNTSQPPNSTATTNTNYTASATPEATANEQQANATLDDEQPVPVNEFIDTTGYPIEIKIIDKDGVPQPEVEVTLGDKTTSTDENGIATFYGVVAGEYTVKANGVESTIIVGTGEPSIPQSFELTQTNSNSTIYVIVGLAILLILIVSTILLIKNRSMQTKNQNSHKNVVNNNHASQTQGKPLSTDQESYLKPDPPTAETIIHPDNKDNNS